MEFHNLFPTTVATGRVEGAQALNRRLVAEIERIRSATENGKPESWACEVYTTLMTVRNLHELPGFEGLKAAILKAADDFAEFVRARAAEPAGAPFFAWLHSKDPHLPYQPSAAHAGRYTGRLPRTPGIEAVRRHALILRHPPPRLRYEHAGVVRFTEADVAPIRALYDETLRDADDRLGRAFAALRQTGLLDRTIVVVSADHGEELFEHGWVGHASTGYDGKLSDELVRIPLVIRLPGGSAGRSTALVQSVDLMPSLFAWLGIDATGLVPRMQGDSLLPLVEGSTTAIREHVFLQTTRKGWTTPREEMARRVTAVRTRDRKLVWWPAERESPARQSAFDLAADAGERADLHAREASRFRDLERAREAWDAENLRATAALLMPVARRHLEGEARALSRGDLLAALHAWRRLYLLHRTWGFEEHPFQADPRLAPPWHVLRSQAGHALARAIDCDLEGRGRDCLAAAGAALLPRAGASGGP